MKNGFYLFIYSQIDQIYNILQLPCRHDQNLTVFQKDGKSIKIICHLEFERFSGIKHHNIAFYNREDCCNYINALLLPYNLHLDKFEGIYGTPGLVDDDVDLSFSSILDEKELSYHTISHLFSSLMSDSKKFYNEDILALAFDGGSDYVLDKEMDNKYLFCGAISKKGKIDYFQISSPGAYWLYLSDYFGKSEGTLMALAYATTAASIENFKPLPYYYKTADRSKVINAINKIIDRIMNYTKEDVNRFYINSDTRFTEEECKISMIIKIIQNLSIQNVFEQIDNILNRYDVCARNTIIALSGGYALNCPTNTQIMNKYHFREQMCIPCVNDGGLAVGMGLYFFHKHLKTFNYKFCNAFYGFSDLPYLHNTLARYSNFIDSTQSNTHCVAADIVQEPVIWIDGRAEIGPRALGHRSILANPAKMEHKDMLNSYKQREWWRPVAPVILQEDLQEWFIDSFDSPYMLNNFIIKSDKANKVPAVLHLDQSARVQSLRYSENPNLYNVISEFKKLTGIPMVCNTSLNDKGEPIINSIEQAINFALRKKIRIIFAYGMRICLKNHDQYTKQICMKRNEKVFFAYRKHKEKLLGNINPYNIPIIDLLIYLYNPPLHKFELNNFEDTKKLQKICKRIRQTSKNLKMFNYLENCLENKIANQ